MNVRRTPINAISESVLSALREYSPFTSPTFMAILGRDYGWGGFVTVCQEQKVIAAMPAVIRGKWPLARLQALLDGLPAPIWVSGDFTTERKSIGNQMLRFIRVSGYLKAHVTDFDNALTQSSFYGEPCNTTIIDLTTISDEFPPDKTLRAEIAKAIRDGVTVTALNRQSQMPDFLTLVNSTEMRHGRKSKYSDRFWNEFAELCEQDSRFSIMCVNADNHLAAAHVYICDRESAHNWQIYFDKSFSSLKPNQAITAQAIAKFQAKGIKSLNLGATPPEATGVADYKKKWGGHEHTYPVFDFRSLLGRALP